jgi:hypothetical protein
MTYVGKVGELVLSTTTSFFLRANNSFPVGPNGQQTPPGNVLKTSGQF